MPTITRFFQPNAITQDLVVPRPRIFSGWMTEIQYGTWEHMLPPSEKIFLKQSKKLNKNLACIS
jgi:hypothetical protein